MDVRESAVVPLVAEIFVIAARLSLSFSENFFEGAVDRKAPGDASVFVGESVPHGQVLAPGEVLEQTWRIRNAGTVPWLGRRLEQQGPLTGPTLITSLRFCDLPDTEPGEIAAPAVPLKAPTYACTSIAYFKVVDRQGRLCFPDSFQLGLDVLVRVVG